MGRSISSEGGDIMLRKAGKTLAVLALSLGLSVLSLAQTKTLTIVHTNDTHSAMVAFGHPSIPGPFAKLLGREVATPAEARKILSLTK